VQGNPALQWSHERFSGRVLGVFFFDSEFLSRPDFSYARFAYFLAAIEALREDLRESGGDLLVLDECPQAGFSRLVRALEASGHGKPGAVSFNRDYEPFARQRDASVRQALELDLGVSVHIERDHLLIEPEEIAGPLGRSGRTYYQVYSPFARRWFEKLHHPEVQKRIAASGRDPGRFQARWSEYVRADAFPDALRRFREEVAKRVSLELPAAGRRAGLAQVERFRQQRDDYAIQRDFPALAGTSRLSLFFKNGSLTVADSIRLLGLHQETFQGGTSKTRFVKELAWREFYYHILWHCPRVETEAFIQKFRNLDWENREDYFEAWKNGKTGFPLVDAGMRELRATGWMHNRVRMVVASFLTKDLLIDWRWGERYFMEALLDGDLAPNNGGWQWAASTGCDPQPYFRVFNPVLQSRKFDPDGTYIRKWVPEACDQSGRVRHEPIAPVVDHAKQKLKALAMYAAAKGESP